MKIRTSLRITSFVSIVTMLVLLPGMVLSIESLRRANAFELILFDLQQNNFERVSLRSEFLLTSQPRAFEQWREKTGEVGEHLKTLSEMSLAPADRALVGRMRRNFVATSVLFTRISAFRVSGRPGDPPPSHSQELERRFANQLFVNAYLLSNSTNRLLMRARSATSVSRDRMAFLLGLFTLALAGTTIVTVAYLSRVLSRGISALRTGTGIISGGDLDYRIPVRGGDELSDLARHFNAMSARLKESYRSLESANRELEGFSYSVSHDLRTPLRHVISFSELLQRRNPEGLDEKSRHYLDVICGGASQMGRLIDDLLAYSRMGRSEMVKKKVRLDDLVSAVVSDLALETAERNLTWSVAPLPAVFGDESMLRLVLGNLLANAVKFTRRRKEAIIEVGSRVEGDEVVVFVRDNGAGFDMKYADKLFGLFQRLHPSTDFEGTGVGLANVRRIIQRHGGRTWAEGKVDEGATFHFSLPVIQEGAP